MISVSVVTSVYSLPASTFVPSYTVNTPAVAAVFVLTVQLSVGNSPS